MKQYADYIIGLPGTVIFQTENITSILTVGANLQTVKASLLTLIANLSLLFHSSSINLMLKVIYYFKAFIALITTSPVGLLLK